jgi:hypothetical protein
MKAKQFLKLFGVLILGVLLTNCAQKFSRTQTDYSCIGEDLSA